MNGTVNVDTTWKEHINLGVVKRYFDFAKYIADGGFTDVENLIDLAFENELNLYQYPVTKAYEVTSCFEGLIEFNRYLFKAFFKLLTHSNIKIINNIH